MTQSFLSRSVNVTFEAQITYFGHSLALLEAVENEITFLKCSSLVSQRTKRTHSRLTTTNRIASAVSPWIQDGKETTTMGGWTQSASHHLHWIDFSTFSNERKRLPSAHTRKFGFQDDGGMEVTTKQNEHYTATRDLHQHEMAIPDG